MSARLIIFAKAPRVGQVKTRLAQSGPLNPRQARAIYLASLREVWRRHALHRPALLYVSEPHSFWATLPVPSERLRLQRGGDLGDKMYHALCEVLESDPEEVEAALILGTDSPQLSRGTVERALEALIEAQRAGRPTVSYGPALDGGYVWVGLNQCAIRSAEGLFRGMLWSTSSVLQESLKRAEVLKLEVHLGAEEWDLDEHRDLEKLLMERALHGPSARICLGQ